jgi:1-deoxy-D-xylulose-5-phosphate synthase
VLVAAVPGSVRFYKEERIEAGRQFCDVGIAEEHAITMAAGMAKNGGKPVFVTDCTFFQRTYDQISHDLCLNNAPVTLLVRNASVWGLRDVTHLGFFDIPMMTNIPNLVYLAPTNQEEYFAMLKWSIKQDRHTVAIRIPKAPLTHADYKVTDDYSDLNKAVVCKEGKKVAVIAVGDFYSIGEKVIELLNKETGLQATLINPRYITGLDTELLDELKKTHSVVVTIEDGSLDGGYGQKIASYYGDSLMKVLNFGLKKEFIDRYDANVILRENRLTPENILKSIKNVI